MIKLNNISVIKGGVTIFEDINFRIGPGEHWVIQGNNGSGKTLLLEVLAGRLHPHRGEVRHSFIEGNDWDTLHRQRSDKIHFIPTHWIQAFLAGFETLFYQQRYYSVDETQLPRVRDILGEDKSPSDLRRFSESFNIDSLLDLPLIRLSNGQLKKVIIVRQLMKNIPRLLLIDYPFDGLDAESRRDLMSFIDELATKFGIQIVMAAHGQELPDVINRRLVLDRCRIVAQEVVNSAHGSRDLPLAPPVPLPETSGDPVVEMKSVTIAYGGKKIIHHLDWCIRRGEKWALTGKNGSGKTTLFSLIYADHPMAYSQKVYLFGKRRGSGESIWDIKRKINYFGPEQIHFLNPSVIRMSGRDFMLQQPGGKPDQLERLIHYFNAESYVDRPVRTLSAGQLQMLLLMNTFLSDRELLLLDEPFQFLDEDHQRQVTAYLTQYLHANKTLVLITHDERHVARWTHHRKHLV